MSDKAMAKDMNLIRLITPEKRRYALQRRCEPGNHSQEWSQWTNWHSLDDIEYGLDETA